MVDNLNYSWEIAKSIIHNATSTLLSSERPRITEAYISSSRGYYIELTCRITIPYSDGKGGYHLAAYITRKVWVRKPGNKQAAHIAKFELDFPDVFMGAADFEPLKSAAIHQFEHDVRCACDKLLMHDTRAYFTSL